MLDVLRNFDALDFVLIGAISLFAGLMLRRWHALAWMVMAALTADYALPLLYFLAGGDGWARASASASARFLNSEGVMLILRTGLYFAAIAGVFAVKRAWGRR